MIQMIALENFGFLKLFLSLWGEYEGTRNESLCYTD